MSHRRSVFKDSRRGMTLALVTLQFNEHGVDEDIALREISRIQRLFTIRVLHAVISLGGRSLLMVVGIPSAELSDTDAAARCAWYDKKLAESGFRRFCGFPEVPARPVTREHHYTGAELNSLDCFLHDLSWAICYQTWLLRQRTISIAVPRPSAKGKYTCQRLDPLHMPRFFNSDVMNIMRGRLRAAGQKFRLNWGDENIYVSRYAAGSRPFVMEVEGITAADASRSKRERKRIRNARNYTEDALWHLYKHAAHIYGERLEEELGDVFLSEFAQIGLDGLGCEGTSNDARLTRAASAAFLPVMLGLCLANGLFRWMTKRRLKKNGTLKKIWEASFEQAKKDYRMQDAPTPALP